MRTDRRSRVSAALTVIKRMISRAGPTNPQLLTSMRPLVLLNLQIINNRMAISVVGAVAVRTIRETKEKGEAVETKTGQSSTMKRRSLAGRSENKQSLRKVNKMHRISRRIREGEAVDRNNSNATIVVSLMLRLTLRLRWKSSPRNRINHDSDRTIAISASIMRLATMSEMTVVNVVAGEAEEDAVEGAAAVANVADKEEVLKRRSSSRSEVAEVVEVVAATAPMTASKCNISRRSEEVVVVETKEARELATMTSLS